MAAGGVTPGSMLAGVEPRVLEYVVAVAEELHFTRAAEKLHVSQPSLSRQIRDLESSLGTKLFERTKQFVRVTPAGVLFVREAREALLHIEKRHRLPPRRGIAPYSRADRGIPAAIAEQLLDGCTSPDLLGLHVKFY